MAVYRLEAWIQHKDGELEDVLEERVKGALKAAGIYTAAGPVCFRVFPNGDPGTPW